LKNKLILSGLFLTTAISCSTFRPVVLNAYINPVTSTSSTYEAINWSYALFNQYASALTYSFRLNYSTYSDYYVFFAIQSRINGVNTYYTDWHTVTATYAEGDLNDAWRNRVNEILFDRSFDESTKLPKFNKVLRLLKYSDVGIETLNLEIIIKSKIAFNVNVGSVYTAYNTFTNASIDQFYNYINFYNSRDQLLQSVLLHTNQLGGGEKSIVYNIGTILTGIRRFDFQIQWVDIPPFATAPNSYYDFAEFNLFTQGQEVSIPDDPSGDRFGFEFVAVEWWNILGHLQNFIWWIINQSPIAPVFEWIEDYVITWVSGLITFITGVFRL
jgi:hypothetical protein